jgi:UDP-galactopyranose mutase
MDTTFDLVCISHLWWSWVWQRPQHLIGRIAQHARVLLVEEPHLELGPPGDTWEVTQEQPNLEIGRLMLRSDADTFWKRLDETTARNQAPPVTRSPNVRDASYLFGSPAQARLEDEVRRYVATWQRNPLVLWLYTPLAVDFIDLLQPDLVVYDVMDELRAFKFAPPDLQEKEQRVFERADLVFTGGPSLYEARKDRHPSVHLFPSGVEQQHFAQALRSDLDLPAAMRDLQHPVIGFYGVIDERIDLQLLAQAATLRPDWRWVMVGPVLKIKDEDLPQLPNIHYLGKQEYKDLPGFLRVFDVAMMPFALNESTRFISPTKTLEYMAAHKPIVSTPVRDVQSLYGEVVRIAADAAQFVGEIEAALHENAAAREQRIAQENTLLAHYEWDVIANRMQQLITQQLQAKETSAQR